MPSTRKSRATAVSKRDSFFWLGEINKATTVINTEQGLLDVAVAPRIARGLGKMLEAGSAKGAPRPGRVIQFEPLLIEVAGVEATLLHAGRSSQDMHMTASTAMTREATLSLARQLHETLSVLVALAEVHVDTYVPNYTNGVAAQPNSYGHYLLGHAAGLLRDADRLREYYIRLDRSPMGTTVLNGTSWPLDRARMAGYLGFWGAALADNAFDAVQIRSAELPVELGALATSMALHVGTLVQDVMVQYSQPRPWILLREGDDTTYASSAMPQKRNPGLLNSTRADASRLVTTGVGRAIQAHNVPSGMIDSRSSADNNDGVVGSATALLASLARILRSLEVSRERALEELNSDWTASQEVADVLMRRHKVPFRVGHHFASEIVSFARARDIRPSEFPYAEAERLFAVACRDLDFSFPLGGEYADDDNAAQQQHGMLLPMTEAEFRETLDPVAIVRNRKTSGGPQPSEMSRMLTDARAELGALDSWIQERLEFIENSLQRLNADFGKLLQSQ